MQQTNKHIIYHMTKRTHVHRCPCLYLYLKTIHISTKTHPAVLGRGEEDKGSQKIRKFRVSIFISESNSIKNCNVCFYFFLQVRIGSSPIPNLSGQGFESQLGSHQPTLTRCPLCKILPFSLDPVTTQLQMQHCSMLTSSERTHVPRRPC